MNIERKDYSDYKISDIMKIKNSYGFRVTLIFYDGSEVVQQKSGYKSTKEARTARDKTVSELYSHTYVVDISHPYRLHNRPCQASDDLRILYRLAGRPCKR